MPRAARSTILIVDDQLPNRALMQAYLSPLYDLYEAPDGPQAMEILSRTSVDLVLLDVMMPGMSGIEVCSIIKSRSADGPYQPVILLTALGAQEDRNRGLAAGADDFLTKPVDRHELLLRVKSFVRLRQQDDRIRHQLEQLTQKDRVIQHQLEELQSLDALKDDLVSMMVHDLRNPLSGIMGFLDVLRSYPSSDGLQEDALMALQASERLREILGDLDLTRARGRPSRAGRSQARAARYRKLAVQRAQVLPDRRRGRGGGARDQRSGRDRDHRSRRGDPRRPEATAVREVRFARRGARALAPGRRPWAVPGPAGGDGPRRPGGRTRPGGRRDHLRDPAAGA